MLGAVTVVALVIPGSGVLGRLVDEWLRPAFGQGAWLLAILLVVAGVVVERGSSVANGWSVAAVGALITFIAGLALLHLVAGGGHSPAALRNGGGALGDGVGGGMAGLLGTPAALIVLLGLIAAGLILLFNTTLRQLLSPAVSGGKIIASAVSTPARSIADSAANKMAPAEPETKERKPVVVPVERSVMPEPMSSPLPISQTVVAASPRGDGSVAVATRMAPAGLAAGGAVAGALENGHEPEGGGADLATAAGVTADHPAAGADGPPPRSRCGTSASSRRSCAASPSRRP